MMAFAQLLSHCLSTVKENPGITFTPGLPLTTAEGEGGYYDFLFVCLFLSLYTRIYTYKKHFITMFTVIKGSVWVYIYENTVFLL